MKANAIALLLLAAIVWCLYFTYIKAHVREVAAPTYAEFLEQAGEMTLPESAKNIRFAWSSVSMGGRAHIGKFEAPLEDCKAYGLAEFRSYDSHEVSPEDLPFVELDYEPYRPDLSHMGIEELVWFDVENIEQAVTLERDHSHRPFIWIDTRRNILYTFWTD